MAGLAARLRAVAPSRASAALYFGLLGTAGHGLVALTFWLGVPAFTSLAVRDPGAAQSSWAAFAALIIGAEGFGNLFLSLSMIAAGWAMVSTLTLSVGAGWIGVLAGLVTIVRIYAVDTPLAGLVSWSSSRHSSWRSSSGSGQATPCGPIGLR